MAAHSAVSIALFLAGTEMPPRVRYKAIIMVWLLIEVPN